MWITSSLATVLTPTAIALGNFDGVHRGHRCVIQPIFHLPPEVLVGCPRPYPTTLTFDPHPQAYFSGQPLTLLTPKEQKAVQLERLGVEQLMFLPFNRELAMLEPREFVEQILARRLQACFVSVGENFRFGRKRSGSAQDLRAIAAEFGIKVALVPLKFEDGERISSSAIREALRSGDIGKANRLLGRSYTLSGRVERGQQLGRTLGFPTANLAISDRAFLPRTGVYGVWVGGIWRDRGTKLPGVMNLGYRPTVAGTQLTVEVHVLDWVGDLYGQVLTIDLVEFLRTEERFASLDDLKAQIQQDCGMARRLLVEGDRPFPVTTDG